MTFYSVNSPSGRVVYARGLTLNQAYDLALRLKQHVAIVGPSPGQQLLVVRP